MSVEPFCERLGFLTAAAFHYVQSWSSGSSFLIPARSQPWVPELRVQHELRPLRDMQKSHVHTKQNKKAWHYPAWTAVAAKQLCSAEIRQFAPLLSKSQGQKNGLDIISCSPGGIRLENSSGAGRLGQTAGNCPRSCTSTRYWVTSAGWPGHTSACVHGQRIQKNK